MWRRRGHVASWIVFLCYTNQQWTASCVCQRIFRTFTSVRQISHPSRYFFIIYPLVWPVISVLLVDWFCFYKAIPMMLSTFVLDPNEMQTNDCAQVAPLLTCADINIRDLFYIEIPSIQRLKPISGRSFVSMYENLFLYGCRQWFATIKWRRCSKIGSHRRTSWEISQLRKCLAPSYRFWCQFPSFWLLVFRWSELCWARRQVSGRSQKEGFPWNQPK